MRVNPNYITNLTASVDQSASEEARLAAELSSGLRVASLQDDPVAAAQSTLLGSSIAKDDTFVQTASNEASRMQVSDSTLGEVVTQITSALSTAVAGNNGTLNASDLASIAQKLSGIRDQVLSLANTSYQGQYLFGGSQGSAPPFTLDSALSRLQATSTSTQTEESQLKVAQSNLVSADPAAVATQLSQAETQHQALLSVINALGSGDLFSLMR